MFRRAKEQCDYLIVGVVTDEGVRDFKGTEPYVPFDERVEMVRSCRYVDEVVVYRNVKDIVQQVDFDVFVKGPDQQHSGFQESVRWCVEHGKQVVTLPRTDGISTTELKELIRSI